MEDTVALYTNLDGESTPTTAWEQWGMGDWYAYDELISWNIQVSHRIKAYTTSSIAQANFVFDRNTCAGDSIYLSKLFHQCLVLSMDLFGSPILTAATWLSPCLPIPVPGHSPLC
jgi:hypothetical protein